MSYKTYRLCLFTIFLAFKSGLATNNHIGLLIVCLIINIFPFHFRTRICYVFHVSDTHHNLLVITHCKLITIEPQFFSPPRDFEILGWCPVGPVLPHGEKVPLYPWLATLLVMVSQ